MKDEKFILYVQTSDEPERQYSPLVLAQTACMHAASAVIVLITLVSSILFAKLKR